MITAPSYRSFMPPRAPVASGVSTVAAPNTVAPQGDWDLGNPLDPRSAWTLLFSSPIGSAVGAVIGGVWQGRAGAAVGALAGGLVGTAIAAIPRVWAVLTGQDGDHDIRQQLGLLGVVAGMTLGGARIGRSIGGPKGALMGALIGSGAAIVIPLAFVVAWLIILGRVWGNMGRPPAAMN